MITSILPVRQEFFRGTSFARSITYTCGFACLLSIVAMLSGCKHHPSGESEPHVQAGKIEDTQASLEIAHVEDLIARQLEHVNLDVEGHDASTEDLRLFVATLAGADVQACPTDFKQQFATSLGAWQKVLTNVTTENAYLHQHPEEDPEKGG